MTGTTAVVRPRRAMIYMFFNAHGEVPEYVPVKLRAFREHVDRLVVVCNGILMPEGREALDAVADEVHVRRNEGFDVWAYRAALVEYLGWDTLKGFDEVILANYTFYGPLFPLAEMFDAMGRRAVDFWGITGFVGPAPNFFTNEGFIPSHIQSYFIVVGSRLLRSPEFRAYWEEMKPIRSYVDSVLEHETRFTEWFEARGFRHGLYCDPAQYPVRQAAYEAADLLVADRCPILKRKAFFNDPLNVDASDVRLREAVELVQQTSDYDVSLIWKDIARVAKPRDLYTNATLLEVLPDEGPPAEARPRRVAVMAHVFYPELLEELLPHLRNIPGPFDLLVTTSSAEKKDAIERRLAQEPSITLKLVRVVTNRGRDVSALLIGLREEVLDGGYELVCRLHSKASPQDTFGMARHFKEHLYENLLASPTYVSKVLERFEREPRLGLMFPPTIHIGYGTLGRSWFGNKPGAHHWAERLGIEVPFDDDTPLCAHGSMYWFRPRALAPLFKYPFKWTDFPEEPHYADGDLPHVLERLVVYAAHQEGFISRAVLTPRNAVKNYTSLEFKLHRLASERRAARLQVHFPAQQLKEFTLEQFKQWPTALGLARRSYQSTKALVRRLRGSAG